jgi:septum formation protein
MRNMRTIILASASPRRKELLEKTGLKFKVDESGIEERVAEGLTPHAVAKFLSREKARDVARRHKDCLIISADTIVVLKGKVFGKPKNEGESKMMLNALSGRAHYVISGFTILDTLSGKEISKTVETKVFLKRLDADEIDAYVRSGEPFGKAGAYGIQGLGSVMIRKIEGDFFNVVGLPLNALAENLKKFGIRILD